MSRRVGPKCLGFIAAVSQCRPARALEVLAVGSWGYLTVLRFARTAGRPELNRDGLETVAEGRPLRLDVGVLRCVTTG